MQIELKYKCNDIEKTKRRQSQIEKNGENGKKGDIDDYKGW
jgi:hypothetical protein